MGLGESVSASLPRNVVDGGLAVIKNDNGSARVFYLAGGTADSGATGAGIEANVLYSADFDLEGQTPSATTPFVQIADFNLGEFGGGNNGPGPVLAGLGFLDGQLYSAQRRFNGAPSNQADNPSRIVLIDFDTRGGIAGPSLSDVLELPGADLQSVTGANSRGTIFATGLVNPETPNGSAYENLAVFEIDPRISGSPYIRETFWGSAGDFNAGENTSFGPGFSPDINNDVEKVGGSAMLDGKLVINAFSGVQSLNGQGQNGFFLTVNPDYYIDASSASSRVGSIGGSPLDALNTGAGVTPIGFSGLDQASGVAPPPRVLDDSAGGRDYSIGTAFGQISYSGDALRSGVIQQVFRQRFIETSFDPVFCAIDPVIGQIPTALQNNVNKTQGIARTTYDLRNPLDPNHPCNCAKRKAAK